MKRYVYFLRPEHRRASRSAAFAYSTRPKRAVREFREAQERQHFPLREGEHCRTCPHFTRLCPARLCIWRSRRSHPA